MHALHLLRHLKSKKKLLKHAVNHRMNALMKSVNSLLKFPTVSKLKYRLGKYKEERDGKNEEAILAYDDCLSRKEDHKEAMIALANLYQGMGNNDKCMSYCKKLLKIDPSNE